MKKVEEAGSQGQLATEEPTIERTLTPYHSPAYRGLMKSLGKEIKTGRYVENAHVGYDGKLSNSNGELLFSLSEVDGKAIFTLRDARTSQVSHMSEQELPSSQTGSFSQAFDIVSQIKIAQSYALKDYANLGNSPMLFPVREANQARSTGMPSDSGSTLKVVDGELTDFEPKGSPELLYFSAKDFRDRTGVQDLTGLVARTKYLSVKALEVPNGTNEFETLFQTSLSRKGRNHTIRYDISLANIPMLRWGMPVAMKRDPFKISGSLPVARNFRWELIFPRSETVLGSAAWNDLTGIQGLINLMQDTEYLRAQQALAHPEFFLS